MMNDIISIYLRCYRTITIGYNTLSREVSIINKNDMIIRKIICGGTTYIVYADVSNNSVYYIVR